MNNLAIVVVVSVFLSGSANGHSCGPMESNKIFPYMEITPTDFSKKFVAQPSGQSEVQFEESGGEVEIRCWSKSSFIIEFHGHITNRDAIVDNIEIIEPVTGHRCYSAKLRILQLSRSTGEYSCRSLDDKTAEVGHHGHGASVGNTTSVYVFIKPNNTHYLLHRHNLQPIKVERKWDAETVMIPCAVSDPDAEITLMKRVMNAESEEPWTEVVEKRFDPKLGWILPATEVSNGFVYRCSSRSEKDLVEVVLVPTKNFTVEPDLRTIRYKPGSVVNFTCSAGVPVEIVADDVVSLGDPMVQEKSGGSGGIQNIYQVTRKLSVDYNLDNKQVTCLATATNESLHIWNIFTPISGRANRKDISVKINSQLDRESRLVEYPCNNLLECGVRRCQTYDTSCPSPTNPKSQASGGELMELLRPGKPPVMELFFKSLINNNYYHTWRNTSIKDVLQVSLQSNQAPEGSSIGHFVCQASAMVLAAPVRWYLQAPGTPGGMISIPRENVTTIYGSTRGIIHSEARISIPSNADHDNVSIRCEAPIWSPEHFSISVAGAIHQDLVLNTTMMAMMTKPAGPMTIGSGSGQGMKPATSSGTDAMKSNSQDHHDHKNHNNGSPRSSAGIITSESTIIVMAALTLVFKRFVL